MPSIEQSPGIFQLSKRHLTLECNDDTQSTDKHTSYKSYPPQKPFINNPPIDRCSSPSAAFPENINQGIMNAISKLHEKMLSLEGDRVKSTRHVKSLHNETNVYNTIVQDEMNHETPGDFTCTLINQSAALAPPTALSPPTDSTRVHNPTREHCFTPPLNSTSVDDVTFGTTEVHKRLQCAEEQAFDLEKALSGMRTMLNDRSDHKFPDYRSAGVLSAPPTRPSHDNPAPTTAPTSRLFDDVAPDHPRYRRHLHQHQQHRHHDQFAPASTTTPTAPTPGPAELARHSEPSRGRHSQPRRYAHAVTAEDDQCGQAGQAVKVAAGVVGGAQTGGRRNRDCGTGIKTSARSATGTSAANAASKTILKSPGHQTLAHSEQSLVCDEPSIRIKSQLDKISQLEIAQLRLASTQTLSENKITELEEKLREEKFHRKLMQEKAAQLQITADTNQQMLDEVKRNSPPFGAKKKTVRKTSPSSSSVASVKPRRQTKSPPPNSSPCRPCTKSRHASRPKLSPPTAATLSSATKARPPVARQRDSPTATTTTTATDNARAKPAYHFCASNNKTSHSMNSNLQEVWSLLNTHNAKNKKACSPPTKKSPTSRKSPSAKQAYVASPPANLVTPPPTPPTGAPPAAVGAATARFNAAVTGAALAEDSDYLLGLLAQLQQEFTYLSDKHSVCVARLEDPDRSPGTVSNARLNHKIEQLLTEMHTKAQQINNLREYFIKTVSPVKSAPSGGGTVVGGTPCYPLGGAPCHPVGVGGLFTGLNNNNTVRTTTTTDGVTTTSYDMNNGQVQVTTTIKTNPTNPTPASTTTATAAPSPASAPAPTGQRLLNNIRDVKYKLKKQDLSWCNY